MKPFQCVLIAIALLIFAGHSHGAEPPSQIAKTADLDTMLVKYAEAATKFYDGQPGAVKELWSHADDVTLSGAAGGETAKGWSNVSARLDWASSQFSKGSKDIELIQKTVRGDFAYIVQYEHILFYPPGNPAQSKRDYRVTTIFRREPEGWRVVHRHADTLMTRQTIQ
ncbi:nuclear transport factor 2 family protein [Lysobacter sp. CFH 32150]|uniref:nuclear transport factor 2 family protein n=1 Tax=Lysobacter sp. CFH 32150 TaxID=2927128 RepID=UPI001FA7E41B|nr:nuclear transport factor 2 family protein [Lysobacter sp. CFH 32150]MCI4566742.1 nuclear transport factor 2 family protein [Lysobacter sp. CFH 32150]